MAAISKGFAKIIVKNYKNNVWQPQHNAGFTDTAFFEFTKAELETMIADLGQQARTVRIYLAKYPTDEVDLTTIAETPGNFKPEDRITDAELATAITEFSYVKDPSRQYQNHTTAIIVGVDGAGEEIFQGGSLQNHTGLRPPNPPSENTSLHDDCYVS